MSDHPNIEPVYGCRVCGDKKRHSPLSWKLLARYRSIGIPSQDFGISGPADVPNVSLGRFYVCQNCIPSRRLETIQKHVEHERDLLECMLSRTSLTLPVPPAVDCSSSASAAAICCSPIIDESGSEVGD